jgi:GTP-binding protein
MLPVVAIVGRPNVGKSTLFNRLTRTRDALISSFPGMTRDRKFGEVRLDGKHFIIIDTGGITEETDDVGKLITKQAMQAIEEADKVLFLIDGRAGVTPEDKMIADTLRRSGKRLLLAVNKTEGLDPSLSLIDAYELGLGAPVAIAAVHGSGIANLIEKLFPAAAEPQDLALQENEETEETKENPEGNQETSGNTPEDTQDSPEDTHQGIKLAIIGRPNVGKSTLTNRMLGEERVIVHDSPGTTRDSIFIPLERLDKHYTLIDTAGVRKRKKVFETTEKFSVVKTLQAIQEANVVLYVVDARLGVSDQDLKLLGFVLECGKALVIAVNKWDGMDEEAREYARATIDRHLDFVRFARVHYISALHGSGVGNLFDSVNEAYESATKKLSTPQLSRLLEQAQETHQPPLVQGRRVKLRYAHPGGYNPPCIIIHGNQLHALPESYRKFLAHFYQKKLNMYGTPVLIEFKTGENPFKK